MEASDPTMRFPSLLLSFACAATVAAAPAWKAELTSPAKGPHPELRPIALDFQMSWKGMINSGVMRMEFSPPDARKAGTYTVRSTARSHGVAGKLYPHSSQFLSEIQRDTLRPRQFHSTQSTSKERNTTTVRYFADRAESRRTSVDTRTSASETSDKTFQFGPVHDTYSAMLHVRSQRLLAGDRVTLVVQSFDTPYLLRVRSHGSVQHNGRPAIQLSFGMQKIDRDTLELKPYKKLKRDATLWISDDADRIPLEFRASVFIGDVRATLAQATPF